MSFCVVVFFFSAIEAFGCTCMGVERPIENEFKNRDAIFSGKVLKIAKTDAINRLVTVKVENSWKGKASKTVTVSTSVSSMCGYTFTKGESYLIYAYAARNRFSADICSRTQPLSNAEDNIEILNELAAKESKTISSPE